MGTWFNFLYQNLTPCTEGSQSSTKPRNRVYVDLPRLTYRQKISVDGAGSVELVDPGSRRDPQPERVSKRRASGNLQPPRASKRRASNRNLEENLIQSIDDDENSGDDESDEVQINEVSYTC